MIRMKRPSLVINSHDVPWPRYRMWETIDAAPGTNAQAVVEMIVRANRQALMQEESPLANVVINCHGGDGGGVLWVGGENDLASRINQERLAPFALLKKRNIGTIWLVACQAAADPFGKSFCQQLSSLSNCQVVAADEDQYVGLWGGSRIARPGGGNQIDEFEGNVFSFTPAAGMATIDPHESIFTILE